MYLDSHIRELKRRHQAIERAMARERARHEADDRMLTELRRRTQLLREAIERQR
jgi:hypothetical protein